MFRQIVYISTMRAPVSADECGQILRTSRRNNARDGITGLLVVGGNRFLQLLEGPSEAVEATYQRIRGDERHFATVVLADKMVDARQCPEWAMGHAVGAIEREDASLGQVVEQLSARIDDPILRAHFTGFAEVHSHVA